MVQHQDYSVTALLKELYSFFGIKVKKSPPVVKKSIPLVVKEAKKKTKVTKPRRYDDIDGTPIDEATMNELKQLRDQHMKASKSSPSMYMSQAKKKSN